MPEHSEHMPTLAELALKYGTITKDQYIHINQLVDSRKAKGKAAKYSEMLLEQNMATSYQIDLLILIRDYHIIRCQGEAFGKIAIAKGFATEKDIQNALEIQKKEFKKSKLKKLMGEILVENEVITAAQKERILKEQILLDQKNKEAIKTIQAVTDNTEVVSHISLPEAEANFLRVKGLDMEFSAALIEKGLASEADIEQARHTQEEIFKKRSVIKILGDILVSMEVITTAQKNIILEAQGRQIEKNLEEDVIPAVQVFPTEDGMAAWLELTPKKDSNISIADIKSRLAKEGIIEGIYSDILLRCWLEDHHTRFPVARQDFSEILKDARRLESLFHINLSETGEKRNGDLLVRQAPEWHRIKRVNIYGKETMIESPLDFTINCGAGTRLSKDKASIVAAKTGVPRLSALRSLFIHPIINVLEDVDQRYGEVEAYANLVVSGTITGAYPVTAGDIRAREIRGGVIEAIGGVKTSVGMTDATIKAQGDVHARYLHNCRIETYGNVYVENEIFDSNIRCSGKLDSPACRIINSNIYAKQGVCILGAGSEKTRPCKIIAGGEQHIVAVANALNLEMQSVSRQLEDIKNEYDGQKSAAAKLFQKMAALKNFHDRAKEKKKGLAKAFKKNKERPKKSQTQNVLVLISQFDKRMEKAIVTLKELNKNKKSYDATALALKKQIKRLEPKIEKKKLGLAQQLFAALELSRSGENNPEIEIKGKAWKGTVVGGAYSYHTLDQNQKGVCATEISGRDGSYTINIQSASSAS